VTHEDAGHYAAKHPAGTTCDPAVAAAVRERMIDGTITCPAAHEAAEACGVAPVEIGRAADLLECRLSRCQLGLFGYSPQRRIVEPAAEIGAELRERLTGAATDGRISCAACWAIADTLRIERMAAAAGCELLGLKITHCQLGAF